MFIPDLLRAMRDATTDCLSAEMRRLYLDESEGESRERYEACERSYGRAPFYADGDAP